MWEASTFLDCYWVGSLDFNFLVEIKWCFPLNQKSETHFLKGGRSRSPVFADQTGAPRFFLAVRKLCAECPSGRQWLDRRGAERVFPSNAARTAWLPDPRLGEASHPVQLSFLDPFSV